MDATLNKLPKDSKSLQEMVIDLRETVAEKTSKLKHQKDLIDQLLEAIRLSKHQHFGTRSEKFNAEQLDFLLNEIGVPAQGDTLEETDSDESERTVVKSFTRKKGGRSKLPDRFPRVEVVYELEGDACQCEHCQSTLQPIGQKISEQIDFVPMTVQVIRRIRKTYQCPQCKEGVHSAKAPVQPIPGSIASPGTLAQIITDKYINGMPLYRQEVQFNRLDIPLTRSTIAQWVIKCGLLVQPLINLAREQLLAGHNVQMDETRWQVLKELGKTAQSLSYMWVQRGGPPDSPIILFDYSPSRSQDVPVELLGDYAGYLQTDGYEGYNKVCRDNGITQLSCWAHVRRKFDEALKSQTNHKKRKTSLANQALQRIQLLYKIEKEIKHLTPEARQLMRQEKAEPILKGLREWLDQHLPVVVKQSAIGKAMHYLHKQWPKLIVYTQDGLLHIDNNLCENAIRPFVIGRKNSLFSDSVRGAKASANLYSLIETAKANGVEPYGYLKRVFTELPQATCLEDIEALLPYTIEIPVTKVA